MAKTVAPIVVYLDSQDFSRFSPGQPEYENFQVLQKELLQLKVDGIARFVFSEVHVRECFPRDPQARQSGLARIQTMATICGRDHLPSTPAIMTHELQSLLTPVSQTLSGRAFNWFPDFEFDEPVTRKKNPLQAWADGLPAGQLNRHARRVLAKQVAKPAAPIDRAGAGRATDEFMRLYPFLESGRRQLSAYFRRQGPWSDVKASVEEGLRDLPGFTSWLADHWDHGEQFMKSLRDPGRSLMESISKVKMSIQEQVEKVSKSESPEDLALMVRDAANRALAEALKTIPRKLLRQLLGLAHPPDDAVLNPERTPSLWLMIQFCWSLMQQSGAIKNARTPLTSDFGDALHVMYVPYVDIFRADRNATHLLRNLPCGGTQILPVLQDLPQMIRELQGERLKDSLRE